MAVMSNASGYSRAGHAPAGQLLFLACPSKSNQKERHPAYRPQQKTLGGYPALLAIPGGCGIRSFVPVWALKVGVPLWETRASRSDSPRRLPPAWLCYSAVHRGPTKPSQHQWDFNALWLSLVFWGTSYLPHPLFTKRILNMILEKARDRSRVHHSPMQVG